MENINNYHVGQVLEVYINKKYYKSDACYKLVGKLNNLTCFIAKNTILEPKWGSAYLAKVLRVHAHSLIVSLIEKTNEWATDYPNHVYYRNEYNDFCVCEEVDDRKGLFKFLESGRGDRLYS